MKKFIQTAARHIGIDVLSYDFSREFIYDHHLRDMLDRHDIQHVYDIGANIGGFGNALRSIGFKGSIHSFEPASSPYAMLESQASKDENWWTYKFAFGEKS